MKTENPTTYLIALSACLSWCCVSVKCLSSLWWKDRRVFVRCFALPQTAFVMDVIVQGMETIRGYVCLTLVPLNGFTFLLRCKKPVFCGTAAYAFTSCWNGSNGEWCSTFLFAFMCSCVSEKCNVFCKDGRDESWCQWKRVTDFVYISMWWGEWAENGREYTHSDCMALRTIG